MIATVVRVSPHAPKVSPVRWFRNAQFADPISQVRQYELARTSRKASPYCHIYDELYVPHSLAFSSCDMVFWSDRICRNDPCCVPLVFCVIPHRKMSSSSSSPLPPLLFLLSSPSYSPPPPHGQKNAHFPFFRGLLHPWLALIWKVAAY